MEGSKWSKSRVTGICVLPVGLVLAVFGQASGYEFVNDDDPACVGENPVVLKGLTLEGLRWAFTHVQLGEWFPLATLSHMAEARLYGSWAGGHHLTNVLLHAVAVVLLFLLLLEMTAALWQCAFAAAVWAIPRCQMDHETGNL